MAYFPSVLLRHSLAFFSVFFVMRVNTPMAFFCPHVTPDSARAFNAF